MSTYVRISYRRMMTILVQIVTLVSVIAGLQLGLLGNYLPTEFWMVVRIYLIASIILHILRAVVVSSYRRRNKIVAGTPDNFVLGMNSLTELMTFFVTAVGILWVLQIPFQTFLTSLSLVAVALVLIFRDYISNYLDSFRLMFSTDFKIGNYVKVGENSRGVISDISFRATKLKTDEGDVLYIPNTKFITSEVVNYSKVKYKRITVPFALPTDTIHPLSALEERLKGHLLSTFPDSIQEAKIFLRILDIREWHTHCALEVSVNLYNFDIEDAIVKVVYSAVLEYAESAPPTKTQPVHAE